MARDRRLCGLLRGPAAGSTFSCTQLECDQLQSWWEWIGPVLGRRVGWGADRWHCSWCRCDWADRVGTHGWRWAGATPGWAGLTFHLLHLWQGAIANCLKRGCRARPACQTPAAASVMGLLRPHIRRGLATLRVFGRHVHSHCTDSHG